MGGILGETPTKWPKNKIFCLKIGVERVHLLGFFLSAIIRVPNRTQRSAVDRYSLFPIYFLSFKRVRNLLPLHLVG